MIIVTPIQDCTVDMQVVSNMFKEENYPDEMFRKSLLLNSAEELNKIGYANPINKLKKIEEIIADLTIITKNTDRNLCVYADDECVINICQTIMAERGYGKRHYHVLFHTENDKFVIDNIFPYSDTIFEKLHMG